MSERFTYERSEWSSPETERWIRALEEMGPENVRSILHVTYGSAGLRAMISSGQTLDITKGFAQFAQAWLSWHDKRKANAEASFCKRQIFWIRWAGLAASIAAAAIGGWSITEWLK